MSIARVQFTTGGTDGGSGGSVATANFGSSCTSGNQVLVFIRNSFSGGGAGPVSGVTDTLGTTYANLVADNTRDPRMEAWLGTLTASGTNAVTAAFTGNGFYPWIHAIELRSVDTTSQVDQAFSTRGTGSTDCTSASFSTDTAGEYVALAIGQDNLASYSAGADFTLIDGTIPTNPSDFGGVQEYIPGGTLSGYTAHITSSISNDYTLVVVSLRPAGGGGGGNPMIRRWGGMPYVGGQSIGNKGSGRMWGRTREGVIVPRRLAA